ncbi:hypothetical protein D3C72_1880310 [compost metagenome]
MAKAERRLLAGEARRAGLRQNVVEKLDLELLVALAERLIEFDLNIEIVLDDGLAAAGDEDQVLDAGFHRLVDHILNDRLVHHRQHFLRHGLGSRQETRAQTSDREHGFADFTLVGHRYLLQSDFNPECCCRNP